MDTDREIHLLTLKEPSLIMMFKKPEGGIECHLCPMPPLDDHIAFGVLVADLVRHVARCFEVSVEDVMVLVTDELINHPNTAIEGERGDAEDLIKRSSWKRSS